MQYQRDDKSGFLSLNQDVIQCLFGVLLLLLSFALLTGQAWAASKEKAADKVVDGQPLDRQNPAFQTILETLKKKHQFSTAELDKIFKEVTLSKRVLVLMDRQWEAKPYYQYRTLFITAKNVAKGKVMLKKHAKLLAKIEKELGVEREILLAIWGIESRYGQHQGSFGVLRTLSTLATAYPRRAKFFGQQLVHFLLLCRENKVAPDSVKGSYAGAFTQAQFIPSSFRAYAVSFDGDARRDLWQSTPDVLASIANYLRHFKWQLGQPIYAELGTHLKGKALPTAYKKGRKGLVSKEAVEKAQAITLPAIRRSAKLRIIGMESPKNQGKKNRFLAAYPNFIAITKWNNSSRYALAVTELAAAIRQK